jgi:hypothetical protein
MRNHPAAPARNNNQQLEQLFVCGPEGQKAERAAASIGGYTRCAYRAW